MNDVTAALLMCIIAFVLGFALGVKGSSSSHADDCKRIGAFIAQDTVFECKVKL